MAETQNPTMPENLNSADQEHGLEEHIYNYDLDEEASLPDDGLIYVAPDVENEENHQPNDETEPVVEEPDPDQVFFLQAQMQQVNQTIVNAETGETIHINETINVNTGSYQGGTGVDTIFFTNLGDALFISDSLGNQVVSNIDTIFAGQGGDYIVLSHSVFTLGNMSIFGGAQDDVIWSNIGNDEIFADAGHDRVDGGRGNDTIYGGGGNDIIRGGKGDDILMGDSDNDELFGGAGSNLLDGGSGDDILHFTSDEADTWTSSFVAHNVGSPDAIIDGDRVSITANSRSYDAFEGGDGIDRLVGDDANNAIFLDDMYSPNPFGTNTARIMNVEIIEARGGNDVVDLTSTQFSYGDVSIYGGDGDDVLWSSAGNDHLYGENGNDHLDGGSGNDFLSGGAGNDKMFGRGGNDTFIMGEGQDTLYGGAGSDTFIYDLMDGLKDTIADFTKGIGGDKLDISDILQGYSALDDLISDFVRVTTSGGNTTIGVNADGDHGGVFTDIVQLTGVTSVDLETLINNGNLVVV